MKKNQGRKVKSNKFKLRTVLKRTNLGRNDDPSGEKAEAETGVANRAVYYFGSRYDCSDVDARLVYVCWLGDSFLYGDYSSERATGTFNPSRW